MQEPSAFANASAQSFANLPGLPKYGAALAELRRLEHGYRELAIAHGFTEVNLPLVAPVARFASQLTGGNLLAPGPRFTDPSGLEWTLRSDMTAFAVQFVLEHASDIHLPARIAYCGKVFSYEKEGAAGGSTEHVGARHGPNSLGFGTDSSLEGWEFGAEIIGQEELTADLEILRLAEASARHFGLGRLTLVLSDARIAQALFAAAEALPDAAARAALVRRLGQAFSQGERDTFEELLSEHPSLATAYRTSLAKSPVDTFVQAVREAHTDVTLVVDPWSRRTQGFYSGITFEIFAQDAVGKLRWVGGGGRYDAYFDHFGKSHPAVGFMLKDPGAVLERESLRRGASVRTRVALPKGRLLGPALAALAEVGIEPEADPVTTRRLVLPSKCGAYEILLVKNTDVPSYLNHETADFALVGSDVLDESTGTSVRPVTFSFGRCRVCLAGKPGGEAALHTVRRPRVATKYLRLAESALRARGVAAEIVPLQGSVELASVIDMADAIVDLVETGSTLRENGLEVYAELGETRVHLACTRGFQYRHQSLLESWRRTWTASGRIKEAGE